MSRTPPPSSLPPPGRAGRSATLAVAAGLALVLAACTGGRPVAPRPTQVYVPRPGEADASRGRRGLLEDYAVSPHLNPDGLGVVRTLWEQSYLTLVPWAAARRLAEANRIAYARTEAEQEAALKRQRTLYGEHVVFEGVLVGDFAGMVEVETYLPEGVYLVDDRGRKFAPLRAESLDPVLGRLAYRVSEFGQAHYGYPRLVFPGGAIGPETRAVTVYLALRGRRVAFTWIFDETYEPPRRAPGAVRQRRLFRRR